jgi:hypothetical protein
MMETMEVIGVDPQEEVDVEGAATPDHTAPSNAEPTASSSHQAQSNPTPSTRKGAYASITAGPQSPTVTATDKAAKKRKTLTPEQKAQLQQIQAEQEAIRKERVADLSKKLLDKISVWAETDRGTQVTDAFKKKLEVLFQVSTANFSMRLRF